MNIIVKFISLAVNRGFDSLLAILLIPLLIADLGEEQYGIFAFILTINTVLIVFVRFGFENYILMSGCLKSLVKRVAQTIPAKGYILFLLTPVYIFLVYINIAREYYVVAFFLWLISLGEIFAISHAFVVINKTIVLTLIGVFRFILIITFAYLFLNSTDSIVYFSLYYGSIYLSLGLLQFVLLKRLIDFKIDNRFSIWMSAIKESKYFFSAKISTILFDKLFLVYCGMILTISEFAKLDVLFKIYAFCMMVPMILSSIVLNIVMSAASTKITTLRLTPIFASICTSITVVMFSDNISSYFFASSLQGVNFIAITSIVASISLVIGELYLVPLGLAKLNSKAISISLFVSLLTMSGVTISMMNIYIENLIIIFLCFKVIEIFIKVYYIVKNKSIF